MLPYSQCQLNHFDLSDSDKNPSKYIPIHLPVYTTQVEVDLKHQRQTNAMLEADNRRLGSRLEDASEQINALYKENRKMQKDLNCVLEGQSTLLAKSTAGASIM